MTRSLALLAASAALGGCFNSLSDGTSTPAAPPPPPVSNIQVSMGPNDPAVTVGTTLQFQAVSNTTVAGWEWSVSDMTRAAITQNGVLLGLSPGAVQARACATNAPTVCAASALTIVAVPPGGAPAVSVDPGSTSIQVGQSVNYAATAVNFAPPAWVWTSLDEATATITASGTLTGRRAGTAVVAACAPVSPRYCGTAVVQVQ